MNCAIYARVSTRDKGQDFTNQLFALRDFAAKQGWAIVNEYIDQQSAKDDDREQFRQLFTDASQRRFNGAGLHADICRDYDFATDDRLFDNVYHFHKHSKTWP